MMANYYLFLVVAFSVLVLNNINFVQCVDKCKIHADCNPYGTVYCCGGLFLYGVNNNKQRSCTISSCLNHYCSTEKDCGDSTMCCRSNRCVNKGCSGCNKNADCYSYYVCCKKTFPFNQTICAASCLRQTCNFNDDCAGYGECCRSGKCTSTGCSEKCTLNSECNLGKYCCRKKPTRYYQYGDYRCSKSCVGEICSTSEDCGGPNECCISNKCVDRGCSGCTTNSNCSTGQYCCKKRQWYELSECSAHCIGKSCNTNDDCGGPGEVCHSYICLNGKISVTTGISGSATSTGSVKEFTTKYSKCSTPLPSWVIAIITICLVVFLIAIGILLAVFFCMKRK